MIKTLQRVIPTQQGHRVGRAFQLLLAIVLITALFTPAPGTAQAYAIPTFSIIKVVKDTSVTIRTQNFPASQLFTVRMGAYGTLGIGGVVVATTNSGAGGTFEETYSIPDSLKGSYRIAIRMDSASGYYSYNWFVNDKGAAPSTGYTGIPTFSIKAVDTDKTVTIRTKNFPANQTFTVRMGAYGTLGLGGVVVATTNSGAGGVFEETYTIPDSLKGRQRIAIRMDSPAGYYSYNWFWNNSTSGSTDGGTGYTGIPTFSIKAVDEDNTVTIRTNNFPANQTFTVRMGAYGTLGIGGVVVATTNSSAGGTFEETYNIPDSLKGRQRIAIRMDSASGYYSYNWFWNNTTSGSTDGGTSGYTGIPTFSIVAVVQNNTVTIQTNNFPANQTFTVRMGAYGTLGLGGVVVATTNSGAGGAFQATYTIPDSLKGRQRIAIRMDSPAGYYSFNWFWNNSTN